VLTDRFEGSGFAFSTPKSSPANSIVIISLFAGGVNLQFRAAGPERKIPEPEGDLPAGERRMHRRENRGDALRKIVEGNAIRTGNAAAVGKPRVFKKA
jgi:hypothetical protein